MNQYAILHNSFFHHKPWWLPQKMYRSVCSKANPRTDVYMQDLLKSVEPKAKEICDLDFASLEKASVIIMYPDAIGFGGGRLEKVLLKHCKEVYILNGRKRYFQLTIKTRRKLLFRRFLEKTMLVEIMIFPILLICGFLLTLKDKFFRFSNVK